LGCTLGVIGCGVGAGGAGMSMTTLAMMTLSGSPVLTVWVRLCTSSQATAAWASSTAPVTRQVRLC